jgi:hypothetical protein
MVDIDTTKKELTKQYEACCTYESITTHPELTFNMDTNVFTFKGIEISVTEALFLCASMPKMMTREFK